MRSSQRKPIEQTYRIFIVSPNKEDPEKWVDASSGAPVSVDAATELDDADGFEFGLDDLFETEWEATRTPFVVADLEVTDVSAQVGEILEFSALLVNPDGEITAEFSRMVRVTGPVSLWLLTAMEISRADIERDGQPFADVMKAFVDFIGDRPVFMHHAAFEEPFLKKAAQAIQQEFHNPLHDTLQLAELTWPKLPRHSCTVLADHLGISNFMETSLDCAKLTLAVLLAAREDAFSGSNTFFRHHRNPKPDTA